MISRLRIPLLALAIAVYLCAFVTSPAIAGMIGSIASSEFGSAGTRTDEINKIQLALENEMVKAKLMAFGLTSEEVQLKLQDMDDRQISLLAQASDDVLAGGDGLGIVIGVLLVILLVIVILKLMDKSVVIK